MSVMFLLIGCSFLIAVSFLTLFLWAVKKGQYEDTYTPSIRMLFEDGTTEKSKKENTPKSESAEKVLEEIPTSGPEAD